MNKEEIKSKILSKLSEKSEYTQEEIHDVINETLKKKRTPTIFDLTRIILDLCYFITSISFFAVLFRDDINSEKITTFILCIILIKLFSIDHNTKNG